MSTDKEKNLDPKDGPVGDDPIQLSMGGLGKWHILVCIVVFLLKFPVAWHQMGIIFLAPPATYTCIPSETESGEPINKCSDACLQKSFNRTVFTETIITEFNLVCDKGQWANLSQTLFMLGILFGNVLFGALSDCYGRRGPLVAAVLIQLLSSVGTSFSTSFWMFCVLRFITAVVTGGTMVTSFVLVMEIIGVKYRELFSVLYQIPFNIGHLTLAVFAYYLRDWRYFQFAISIPSVLLISYYWLVPESPRWLFAVNRVDDAVTVLRKAAKCNKLPCDHIQADIEQYRKVRNALQTGPVKKGNAFDLVRTPNLRMKTICMCFNWFVCGLAFFGLAQYIGQAGGDIFSNVAISAALELPGTILCIYCMKAYGRKRTLICSNLVTGISMLAIAFVDPSNSITIVVLATIGIVGMSISFPTVYLYGGELFPTVVRNVGIGAASMIARIGSMIAPFVAGLGATQHFLPPVIFGVIPIIGSALVLFLPETRGAELPETIEDGENFGKHEEEKV